MKPQDLRIGCYVKLKDSDKIVRVSFLSNRKIGFYWNEDKTLMYYRKYSEIEGVLIFDHHNKIDCTGLMWFLDKGEDESLLYDYDGVTISYIHELQNIHYALMGDELKIEL